MPVRCVAHPATSSSSSNQTQATASNGVSTLDFTALLQKLLEANDLHMAQHNGRTSYVQRMEQHSAVMNALLTHLGVNAAAGNWLETLHHRLMAHMDDALLRVYRGCIPNRDETEVIRSLAGDDVILEKFRERGRIVVSRAITMYRWLVVSTIQRCVGFSVPTDQALKVCACHAPLVEVGAGTGYWSAMLLERGIDVVAYDIQPPTGLLNNDFFGKGTFCNVLSGAGAQLFRNHYGQDSSPPLCGRTLLIVWPNNPDKHDNAHLTAPGAPVTDLLWDAECLEAYLSGGGRTVIYVGEREEAIELEVGARPDCGVSSSRAFQTSLAERMQLVKRVELPSFWVLSDDLTVWRRQS